MSNSFNEKSEHYTARIETVVNEIKKETSYVYGANDIANVEAYKELKKEKPEFIKPFFLSLLYYIEEQTILLSDEQDKKGGRYDYDSKHIKNINISKAVLNGLMRKNLSYTEEEWMTYFSFLRGTLTVLDKRRITSLSDYPINYTIQQIERYLKKNELSDVLRAYILDLLKWESFNVKGNGYWGSDLKKSISKLQNLIRSEDDIFLFNLKTNDIGNEVNEIIDEYKDIKELHQLLVFLYDASKGGKPTKKFKETVAPLIVSIKKETYRKVAQEILQVVLQKPIDLKEHEHVYNDGSTYNYTSYEFLCENSKQFVKGVVWTMESFSDKETIRLLSGLLEKAYKKIPGIGPAAASVGNSCAYTLGNIRGKDGLGALARLKLKLKQNNIKKAIDNYLTEGAKKYNVSVEELKEMAVPDFNLVNGEKEILFDGYKLLIFIDDSKVKQQWFKPDGNTLKTVPSLVKNSNNLFDKLKEVRKEVKEIQKVYSSQKQRIDNQFILNRTWDFQSFKKYYFEHGIVQTIASKLLWTFSKGSLKEDVLLINNEWINVNGDVVDWLDENTTIQLWHPVFSSEENIVKWREKILDLELKQPLKQVFRELYLLTDAEINTRNYSNRMAAHILKQHQFKTLAVLRDWKYALMGCYDDGRDNETCVKFLPEYNLYAQFWIDELANSEDYNDTGIWHYIATDQIRFTNGKGDLLDLIDVPKIVFSEIMRDVDLFVGVCSVGNDPEWSDNNGARQEYRDYWQSYSFGDLNAIAKTRKTILERLLPRLTKLKKKAHIDGKFLVVEGSLRTYKIHIGSGNILMEPNDQYLCIVPARSADKSTDKLFIPFEGDRGLSIVLSKAFLLADDLKITDTTITSQINR